MWFASSHVVIDLCYGSLPSWISTVVYIQSCRHVVSSCSEYYLRCVVPWHPVMLLPISSVVHCCCESLLWFASSHVPDFPYETRNIFHFHFSMWNLYNRWPTQSLILTLSLYTDNSKLICYMTRPDNRIIQAKLVGISFLYILSRFFLLLIEWNEFFTYLISWFQVLSGDMRTGKTTLVLRFIKG